MHVRAWSEDGFSTDMLRILWRAGGRTGVERKALLLFSFYGAILNEARCAL